MVSLRTRRLRDIEMMYHYAPDLDYVSHVRSKGLGGVVCQALLTGDVDLDAMAHDLAGDVTAYRAE